MTQATVYKVSDGSLTSHPTVLERDPTDPQNWDLPARTEQRDLSHTDIMAIEREARALRARVIALMFRRMGRALERAMWRLRQRDVEKYLAKSSDLADLERRIRDLERGRGPGLGGLSY